MKLKDFIDESLKRKAEKIKKGYKKCDVCGERKKDVTKDVDPYAQELHGDDTEINICKDCAESSAADI